MWGAPFPCGCPAVRAYLPACDPAIGPVPCRSRCPATPCTGVRASDPQPAAKKPRRGGAAVEEILALAGRLQMLGPLGVTFACGEGDSGGAFAADLQRTLRLRCAEAWDLPRVRTMLSWWEPFLLASGRAPWVPALELPGMIWNRMTLDLFGEFIRRSPPLGKARGDHVSADAVSSYVGVAHTLRSREARYDVAPPHVDLNAPLAFKAMRREEGPRGDRRLRRGLRAEHLQAAAEAGYDRGSCEQAFIDWAAVVLAHNLLLRGGEVGVPDGIEPDPQRIITFASMLWQLSRAESSWRLWLIVLVVPIKDTNARKRGYPCPVARRHDGPLGTDPLCAYDAVAVAYWLRRGGARATFPVDHAGRPQQQWWLQATRREGRAADLAPFFTVAGGFPFATADTRRIIRAVAEAAGEPPSEFAASSARSGGSTDWRCQLGLETAKSVIKQRGRWESDVNEIYQRPLVEEQLRGSALVGSARGAGLEDVCRGFAQPAVR